MLILKRSSRSVPVPTFGGLLQRHQFFNFQFFQSGENLSSMCFSTSKIGTWNPFFCKFTRLCHSCSPPLKHLHLSKVTTLKALNCFSKHWAKTKNHVMKKCAKQCQNVCFCCMQETNKGMHFTPFLFRLLVFSMWNWWSSHLTSSSSCLQNVFRDSPWLVGSAMFSIATFLHFLWVSFCWFCVGTPFKTWCF